MTPKRRMRKERVPDGGLIYIVEQWHEGRWEWILQTSHPWEAQERLGAGLEHAD